MNQAEIQVRQYSTTAAARLANLREKAKVPVTTSDFYSELVRSPLAP
jgi:hypothetical protein